MADKFLERYVYKLSSYNPIYIIVYATFFVAIGSIPLVYILADICYVKYTWFLLTVSIILPMILTPITLYIFIRLTKHLKHFKNDLDKEIEKNRKKDILLFEQARFVIMGEMLANISHQWKQPLNTINLAILSTRLSQQLDKEVEKNFDIMEDNVNYLASTIDDFLSFFDKKSSSEIKNLETIINEIKSIVHIHLKNRNINLSCDTDAINDKIFISSSISQVILNLINNSKDAILDNAKEKKIVIKFTNDNQKLRILCCDTGSGIDKNIHDKIFDPYFTTKTKTKGTGIGLFMSKEIVHKIFHGVIGLTTESGYNSCFYINLPYSDRCLAKGDKDDFKYRK